jgi:ABC-type glycerol-3-phosphate transport system substrate-binding protein
MKMKTKILALLMVLAMLLAACGGGECADLYLSRAGPDRLYGFHHSSVEDGC